MLENDEQDILIFGDDLAVRRLATTHVIHADGTFTRILAGYSQLYIFNATVENNLSVPVLFCLVKGKNEASYVKLLDLVEGLANEENLTIFNREVTLMCDFELSFINAVQLLYKSVQVKCCFFHFVQNIRKNAVKLINAAKRAHGENSMRHLDMLKKERRIMMLPLVP